MALDTIDRMIAGQVLKLTLVVLAVVVVLAGLFLFIDNQHDVGVGQFGVKDAFELALIMLPGQLVQFMPIAALLGALLGLGQLARERAFIIARSVGISPWRLAQAAGLAGMLLALLALLAGELLNPALTRFADQWRAEARGDNPLQASGNSVWLRDGSRFLRFEPPNRDNAHGRVQVFDFVQNNAHREELISLIDAHSAVVDAAGAWRLANVNQLQFSEQAAHRINVNENIIQVNAFGQAVAGATVDPDGLAMWDLWPQITFLTENGQDARLLEMSLYNRLAHALATVVLSMFAVVFVMGAQRSGQGVRLTQGVAIGLVYLLVTRTVETGGTVYHWPPLFVAWLPLLLLSVVASVSLYRTR